MVRFMLTYPLPKKPSRTTSRIFGGPIHAAVGDRQRRLHHEEICFGFGAKLGSGSSPDPVVVLANGQVEDDRRGAGGSPSRRDGPFGRPGCRAASTRTHPGSATGLSADPVPGPAPICRLAQSRLFKLRFGDASSGVAGWFCA
jgi:hypothetical protein